VRLPEERRGDIMNWKLKALIQNTVAGLPKPLAYRAYYMLQRHLGGLRKGATPLRWFRKAALLARMIREHGVRIEGSTFVEVGTGWRLDVAMALWLMGASRIVTVDLNQYLKAELVEEAVRYVRDNREEVTAVFGPEADRPVFRRRLTQLTTSAGRLKALLSMMKIEYSAPADAAALNVEAGVVDVHLSVDVFEHIPPASLMRILAESKRVLSPGGLLVHRFDVSDHFTDTDGSIPSVNFLRFSESRWTELAGNRFMYHNRLRAYEFRDLFDKLGVEAISFEEEVDTDAARIMMAGFPLAERFQGRSPRELAVRHVAFVGRWPRP